MQHSNHHLALKGESRESGGLGPVLCWLGLQVHHLELRHLRVRLRQDEVDDDSFDGASLMCHVYLYCTVHNTHKPDSDV